MEYGRQSMPRKSKIKFNTKRHKKKGGGECIIRKESVRN